jgi:hypothetical protein
MIVIFKDMMANSTMQAKCGQCGVIAILSPVGGGYSFSVRESDMRLCPAIREEALHAGSSAQDLDCDHLLDAVSGEYRRLLRR